MLKIVLISHQTEIFFLSIVYFEKYIERFTFELFLKMLFRKTYNVSWNNKLLNDTQILTIDRPSMNQKNAKIYSCEDNWQ